MTDWKLEEQIWYFITDSWRTILEVGFLSTQQFWIMILLFIKKPKV